MIMNAPAVKVDPIVIGVVTDLDDPLNLGRVRVEVKHSGGESYWARLATLMAGPDRGTLFRPEPDDEVLLALVQGAANEAYVIGALWNTVDTPPEGGGTPDNDLRTIRSRSGHVLRFDDTPGGEKIEIVGKDEEQLVVIDVVGEKVEVLALQGNVEVMAGTDVTIEANAGSVSVTAAIEINLSAPNITITGDAGVTITGGTVQIN